MEILPREIKNLIEEDAWRMTYADVLVDVQKTYKNKNKWGETYLGLPTDLGYRKIPINIEFYNNSVEVAYEIIDKNNERIGYEKTTNLENDINELLKLREFYNTLVETEYGEIEINDDSHILICDNYEIMDDIKESLKNIIMY